MVAVIWQQSRTIKHEYGGSNMLVLTRKTREAVVVGGAGGFERILKVTVLEINGGKVRLGFEVDATVPVHRLEVWERIRAANSSAPGTK
jgi:carbon storage regulator CsrA